MGDAGVVSRCGRLTSRHFGTDNSEPWAIRGLLAPEFDEPVFAEYLASGPVMEHVHAFIGDDLTMGSILVFTNPHHADYSLDPLCANVGTCDYT